jgi:hypothetical protein
MPQGSGTGADLHYVVVVKVEIRRPLLRGFMRRRRMLLKHASEDVRHVEEALQQMKDRDPASARTGRLGPWSSRQGDFKFQPLLPPLHGNGDRLAWLVLLHERLDSLGRMRRLVG